MPIRSQAISRPRSAQCGITLRQRYDEVGLPCWNTIASPAPSSIVAMRRPLPGGNFFGAEGIAGGGGVGGGKRARCCRGSPPPPPPVKKGFLERGPRGSPPRITPQILQHLRI